MGAGAGFASFVGFVQFGLGIALLIISTSNDFHFAGPDSCVFGPAAWGGKLLRGVVLCDALTYLALLSVVASLIISVSQGVLSLLIGFPPRLLEFLARLALSVAWTGLAIITTVTAVRTDDKDDNPDRTHWRHVGIGLAWGMAGLSIAITLSALLGACCLDVPSWALCCCCAWLGCECCLPHHHHHHHTIACDSDCASGVGTLLEALGLLWLCEKLFRPAERPPLPEHGGYITPGGPAYAPLPAEPYVVYHPPAVQPYPYAQPPPPAPYPPQRQGSFGPVMAPVYAPFCTNAQHMPATMGWGVPAVPPSAPPPPPPPPGYLPAAGPSGGTGPSRPSTAAWYPDVGPAPAGQGPSGSGIGAPPPWATAPPLYKAG